MIKGRIAVAAMAAIGLALVSVVTLLVLPAGERPAGRDSRDRRPDVERVGAASGVTMPQPAPQRAEMTIDVPPPVEIVPGQPLPQDIPMADRNIVITPGESETIAGDGANANRDGLGRGASFADMGGIAVIERTAYVSTSTAIRRVDLKTNEVTTLAGSASEAGCVAGTGSADVRFRGPAGDLVTDGETLYAATGCGVVSIDPATGSSSILIPWVGPLTVGPDGMFYAGSNDGNPAIVRVDPSTRAATTYVAYPAGSEVFGLAADAQYLWASVAPGTGERIAIDRIDFETGDIVRYASPQFDVVGPGQLSSAGNYLYAPSVSGWGVLTFEKRLGSWATPVGGQRGNLDGTWSGVEFGLVRAVASDGVDGVLIVDAGNHTLRRATFSQAAGLSLGS